MKVKEDTELNNNKKYFTDSIFLSLRKQNIMKDHKEMQ